VRSKSQCPSYAYVAAAAGFRGPPRRDCSFVGLGLALAKDLTELHGGTIEATSEGEGKGAAFLVTLPLRREQTAHGAAARPALRASGDSST